MIPFLAALAVFGLVFFVVLSFGGAQPSVRARLEGLRRQGLTQEQAESQLSVVERIIVPITDVPVKLIQNLLPTKLVEGTRQSLVIAGEPMTLSAFLLLRAVLLGSCVMLLVLLLASGAITLSLVGIMVIFGFLMAGVFLPQLWLRQRVGQRQNTIIKSLPDAFDLITTCVEAGLGLDAALSRVAEKVEGPFADELSRTLHEISLGRIRRDALQELGVRTGVPDLISFVNAVIQAERMGSSVGTVLRVQAEQLRVRRRQRAEAQAYRAPVKMIFPLVLCIFPTLFIVILGPAVITIIQDFPGSK